MWAFGFTMSSASRQLNSNIGMTLLCNKNKVRLHILKFSFHQSVWYCIFVVVLPWCCITIEPTSKMGTQYLEARKKPSLVSFIVIDGERKTEFPLSHLSVVHRVLSHKSHDKSIIAL